MLLLLGKEGIKAWQILLLRAGVPPLPIPSCRKVQLWEAETKLARKVAELSSHTLFVLPLCPLKLCEQLQTQQHWMPFGASPTQTVTANPGLPRITRAEEGLSSHLELFHSPKPRNSFPRQAAALTIPLQTTHHLPAPGLSHDVLGHRGQERVLRREREKRVTNGSVSQLCPVALTPWFSLGNQRHLRAEVRQVTQMQIFKSTFENPLLELSVLLRLACALCRHPALHC